MRQDQAKRTKDELEDAMHDLNQSTNRLRRKFDPTSNYLEAKAQMERVMDSARRVNQAMTRGNYGTQPERYWAALRASINDLADATEFLRWESDLPDLRAVGELTNRKVTR